MGRGLNIMNVYLAKIDVFVPEILKLWKRLRIAIEEIHNTTVYNFFFFPEIL